MGWGWAGSRLVGKWEGDAKGGPDWLSLDDTGPRAAVRSSPVMVLGYLLRRRSLAALGAACTRRGLGRSAGAGQAGLTVAGAGGRGPAGSQGAASCGVPAGVAVGQRRLGRPRTPRGVPEAPAARSRAWGAGLARRPAQRGRQRAAPPPRLTLFFIDTGVSDSNGQADWGRERLHSSRVRI